MAAVTANGSPPGQLRRVLSLPEMTAAGVGIIVGAGIYVLVGEAAADAGAAVWMSFALAGVLSALTALSYAELAGMFPRAGAEFEYARHVFPRWLTFLVGWMMAAGLVVAAAAVALGFAAYVREFVDIEIRIPALGLIAGVVAIGAAGVRESIRVTVVLSAMVVVGLLGVVAVALPTVGEVDLVEGARAGGVLSGAALVFFAFIGFDEVNNLAEEARDPTRTIPRAILLGLGISTLLYVLVAVTAVSAVGPERLAAAERPLTLVVRERVSDRAGEALSVVALMATASTTLMALTSASRLIFSMARAGALPAGAAKVDAGAGVPRRALIAAGAVAALFALIGDIGVVAEATDVAIYFIFLAVNVLVIVFRRREPEMPRPFRIRGAIGWVPVAPVLGLAVTVLLMTRIDPVPLGAAVGMGAAGLGLHALLRLRERRAERGGAPPKLISG